MSLRTRVRITNTSNRPIDVGGRWIQPGAFDAFDLAQVPPEWRGAAVVDSTIDIDAGDIIQDGENIYVQQSDGSRAAIVLVKTNPLTGKDVVKVGTGRLAADVISSRTALDALALASTRRVDIVMMGDSNQAYTGTGYGFYLDKAMGERFGIYASPICAGDFTSQQHSATRITASGAPDTPSNADLAELMSNVSGLTIKAQALNANVASASSLVGGIVVNADSSLNVSSALRFWFAWGGSSEFAGGSLKPGVRLGYSPYSAVAVTSEAISTTTDFDGLRITVVDIPAQTRTGAIEGRFVGPTGSQTGPFVNYYARAERVDRSSGASVSTLYSGGGQSAWNMSWALQKAPDQTLTTFFSEIRRLQISAGYSPIVVVYVNTGLNDQNETKTPSRGPARVYGSGSTPAEYVDNIRGIKRRIERIFEINGWSTGELYWLIVPSHPIASPDAAALVSYRAAAQADLVPDGQTSVIDMSTLTNYAEMTANSWYDGGGVYHLTNAGYEEMAQRIVALIP